jgi:transcriptional regulator with XRE-family HTH domain
MKEMIRASSEEGKRIRKVMKAFKITYRSLAQQMDVPTSTIWRFCSGELSLPGSDVAQLYVLLNCDPRIKFLNKYACFMLADDKRAHARQEEHWANLYEEAIAQLRGPYQRATTDGRCRILSDLDAIVQKCIEKE